MRSSTPASQAPRNEEHDRDHLGQEAHKTTTSKTGRPESALAGRWDVLDEIMALTDRARAFREQRGRPFVTLTYAQSLDGSIAANSTAPLALSSPPSLILTHALRASHRAILVGIGCVLADNPHLTVRHVVGANPQPIVVDSHLRIPLTANLFQNGEHSHSPWIAACGSARKRSSQALENIGARIIRVRSAGPRRIDLSSLLTKLGEMGVDSLMVEGGARIITSFLVNRLADQLVITIAPTFVGGLRAVNRFVRGNPGRFPRLVHTHYEQVGEDIVVRGDPEWGAS